MNVDVLAFGAHPDDVECAAAGVILNITLQGGKVVFVDLTQGELGSFGSVESRMKEADNASEILKLFGREQLYLEDGNIKNNHGNRLKVIELIRKYKPRIILANAINDRHPDHKKASELVSEAAFLSGLKKIVTFDEDIQQEKWRPEAVYHYIQDYFIQPDVVVDITDVFEKKMSAIKAYESQFVSANDSSASGILALLSQIESTNKIFGRAINVHYAEGFTVERYVGAKNLLDLL
ncbi:bacillithiol biosynthesis deacetylase BshB1 [Flavobacterium soyangense]|uniref:Bacillithiol biosynthesis deacetylase BshB1 n=1 Tax=Flavobacterium soyangense TaxID=2023265 RepID=A0A930U9P7_9FLAO|nr:bacillithiol biosynthesis deacetylase BshB1 [Flavobacterium soyangense]MBF2708065.1 bacillithiol biosynthesis deacetylase BshB1 [Flavobacterium soyangense]